MMHREVIPSSAGDVRNTTTTTTTTTNSASINAKNKNKNNSSYARARLVPVPRHALPKEFLNSPFLDLDSPYTFR